MAEAVSESDCFVFRVRAFCNIEFSFGKRRKKSLAGETDVFVRFQGRFPNLVAAFSERGRFVILAFVFFHMGRIQK